MLSLLLGLLMSEKVPLFIENIDAGPGRILPKTQSSYMESSGNLSSGICGTTISMTRKKPYSSCSINHLSCLIDVFYKAALVFGAIKQDWLNVKTDIMPQKP